MIGMNVNSEHGIAMRAKATKSEQNEVLLLKFQNHRIKQPLFQLISKRTQSKSPLYKISIR